jgi:hypothetical protein
VQGLDELKVGELIQGERQHTSMEGIIVFTHRDSDLLLRVAHGELGSGGEASTVESS